MIEDSSNYQGVFEMPSLSESTVQAVIERAREQNFSINVAVVDDSGLLCRFRRLGGAVPGAIDVSIKKARTAALFRTVSLELGVAGATVEADQAIALAAASRGEAPMLFTPYRLGTLELPNRICRR
ncbi:GlcG/HbpS family heme-binding protein [Vreelandella olivaria]|uniref:GlcG/HbpS family heme-binding protein n=1 Tax=Vreelandella olivaria TaxID=390919 RepID=UPI00201F009E|nr:heme-binding protein [Halomonas olivaria]